MTLSLQHPATPWDRTLPKPSVLMPEGVSNLYLRRSSSLLQHHLTGNQSVEESYPDEPERRSTVASIPETHIPDQSEHGTNEDTVSTSHCLDPHDNSSKTRTSSVMSVGDTSRSSSPTSTSPIDGSGQFCLCQREPKIPRPRNAFILFRQHHHATVVAQRPGLPNPDISKIIGEQWRRLPDKAKEEWKALAEDEKLRHSQQYPDYRYKPRRSARSGRLTSVSGPSVTAIDINLTCHKCGGKPVTAPLTPYTPSTPGSATMPQMNSRMHASQQLVSPPHSAHFRQYTDAYGRPLVGPPSAAPPPPSHDPRYQYPQMQQRSTQVIEGPESKKRRYNGDAVYGQPRPVYPEQMYQQQPLSVPERNMSEAVPAGQFHRTSVVPARTGYPMQAPLSRSSHAPQQQHRRDLSLTLPPLKTPIGHTTALSGPNGNLQTQKSGVEAMIMSIPVLNKVKILSQIAPQLAAPGPASPPREMRGAIIAVEGMDSESVFNMTSTLADQLERDGNFAVRIFGGPDPYPVLASSCRADQEEAKHLGVSSFLDMISQWHKVSREMQDYITKRPRFGEETPDDVVMQEGTATTVPSHTSGKTEDTTDDTAPRPRTPDSAVSPRTMVQTAELSHQSPYPSQTSATTSPKNIKQPQTVADAGPYDRSSSSTPCPSNTQSQNQSQSSEEEQNQCQATSTSESAGASKDTATNNTTIVTTSSSSSSSIYSSAIPIAIVPHYQLTTVNASSIAMPITDAYSPHSHWQWLATLWRGCIGPDVTVVIQGGEAAEDTDISTTSNHTTTTATAAATTTNPGSGGLGIGRSSSAHITATTATTNSSLNGQRASITQLPPGTHFQHPVAGSMSISAQGGQQPPPPHHRQQPQPQQQQQHPHASHGLHHHPHHQLLHQQQQQPQPQPQQDVEVRLLDCRAVVVKGGVHCGSGGGGGGGGGGGVGSNSSSSSRNSHGSHGSHGSNGSTVDSNGTTSEWWEKAKRRVGFEVEEFLRR